MKWCIFHGNQRELLTCLNPKEMVSLGVFESNFKFLQPEVHQKLFQKALKTDDRIASLNGFHIDEPPEPCLISNIVSRHNTQKFFNWYIMFYYKMPGWEITYPEMVAWYKQKIWQLYGIFGELPKSHHNYFKQVLLELAWIWQQSPDNILPKPSKYGC